nr:phenylacetate--CoA ligase family protein [Bacillota bacterium]
MPDIQQRVYNRLPVWGQNVAVSAYGLVIKHRRYGGEFQRYFHELMDSQWFSKDEIEALQRRKLKEIVRWAYEQVPYQKRRFDRAGIDPYKVECIEDLKELPVMTSQDLRRLGRQLVARNHKGRLYKTYSSGTTGTPTCTYVTADDLRRNYAFAARSLTWAGIPLTRHRMATFGVRMVSPHKRSAPPYWRHDVVADNYHFSIYHQSERTLPAYCRQLSKIRPMHIRAFPSALHVLCSFMKKRPEIPRPPAPVAIITSAETLYDHHRALIEGMLRCKIYDEYGCNELSLLATQCDGGSYHLNS